MNKENISLVVFFWESLRNEGRSPDNRNKTCVSDRTNEVFLNRDAGMFPGDG